VIPSPTLPLSPFFALILPQVYTMLYLTYIIFRGYLKKRNEIVKIIFTSNGFEVIDLGIKVDSPAIIRAINEHKADAVGLSGLLIKSAKQRQNPNNHRVNLYSLPYLAGYPCSKIILTII